MINKIALTNFKKFKTSSFDLLPSGVSFLAGGNNSGKSTFLQALAVWDFCRTVLNMERGRASLLPGYTRQGLGLSDDEFSPVAIASLKHLWTNLKTQEPVADGGYSLKIRCDWKDSGGNSKHLEMALALANDRLFIKAGDTNLTEDDTIPPIAYLPPFAGITNRENLMSGAERRAMIGRGLAGGVIRNLIYDMFSENEKERARLKAGKSKIKTSDLEKLRTEDPWEILQRTLAQTFGIQLEVSPFNSLYHSYIKVGVVKGILSGTKFTRHKGYKERDLMAEGSGFLQWLSVYTLALTPSISTILLDEPDAHLHPTLQTKMIDKLQDISYQSHKQILMATHSTEILRWAECQNVMEFKGSGAKYLKSPNQKVGLFLGLGSDYAPKLDPLRKAKRLLIVENLSDERMLRMWAERLEIEWPKNLVAWPWTGGSGERMQLFLQLQKEIVDLKAVSIRDRDDQILNLVDIDSLQDKTMSDAHQNLKLRVWRRRHIENYLLSPSSIARATGRTNEEINVFMAEHGLVVPDNFISKNVATAMIDARGKQITQDDDNSIQRKFRVDPIDIAKAMHPEEIAEDVKELIRQIVDMCIEQA